MNKMVIKVNYSRMNIKPTNKAKCACSDTNSDNL